MIVDPLCRCGVYWPFQKERNTPVECNSDESHTPGEDKVGSEGWRVRSVCRHLLREDSEAGAPRLHLGRAVAPGVQEVRLRLRHRSHRGE